LSASSSYSSFAFSYFLFAFITARNYSEAAFQLSPVLPKPALPFVPPISFFSFILVCLAMRACYFEVILLASELNSFLFDMKTNLQALACFSSAFLLNFLPQPSGHGTKSF
jgi:hypothetical protein